MSDYDYVAHDTVIRCSICKCGKLDMDLPKTCWDSKAQEHNWQVVVTPRHTKVRSWRLMLLFTWDLLLGKIGNRP